MGTSWSSEEIARAFDRYDDVPEQLLGYRFVFRQLAGVRGAAPLVLDYGCGPGKAALRYVEQNGGPILAVDASESMLRIARRKRAHPLVDYRLVTDDRLDFVDDASLDGAMTCYVFINISSEDRIRRIITEVYRVLKRGSTYVVLDTNPDTTGVDFSTFRSGEPGRRYGHGGQREVRLRLPDRSELVLHDYHWPKQMYLDAFRESGFSATAMLEPTLEDIPPEELEAFTAARSCSWAGEARHPPFVIFAATK